MRSRLQSLLVAHGALVFLVGMVAGFPFAMILLDGMQVSPPDRPSVPGDVRGWRMAHLEGILNGVLLIAVAAVLPRLSLSTRAQSILGWSLIVTAWGNMIASLIGPLFGGRGLALGPGIANNVMFVLFTVAVVTVILAMVLVARGAFRAAAIQRSAAGGAGRTPEAEG
jgi:hypothetical protein